MRAPALYALIIFVSGIVAGSRFDFPAVVYLGVAVVAAAAAIIYTLVSRNLLARIAVALSLLCTGAFLACMELREFPANHISHFTSLDGKSELQGEIIDEPDIRTTKTFLTIEAESLHHNQTCLAVSGLVRVRLAKQTSEFSIGDRVRFSGYVVQPPGTRNPGSFDYRRYLELRQIHAVCNLGSSDRVERVRYSSSSWAIREIIVPMREYISQVFDKYLPPGQSALMRGFLIGDVRFIQKSIYSRFKDTGTLHVLAASGSNVGYVTATVFLIAHLFSIPRRTRYALAIVGVCLFSFLAFNQPSVMRASIMAIVCLVGLWLHRDKNWLNTISIAGLIVLAIHPLYIYDLGTQLSFAAAFSLILFMPVIEPLLPTGTPWYLRLLRGTAMLLAVSVVAQLGVMPILLYHFHTVPLVSFLSNLLVVPLVGIAAIISIVLVFVSAIPYVVDLTAQILGITTQLVLWSTEFFENLRIPQIQIGAPEFLAVVTYYLTLQLLLTIRLKSRHVVTFAFLLVFAINGLVWKSVFARQSGCTRITVFDTAGLSTFFVEQADGQTALINGGGKSGQFDNGEAVILPFLRDRGITDVDQYWYTTEESNNVVSLRTVIEALRRTETVDSLPLKKLGPVVSIEQEGRHALFITDRLDFDELPSKSSELDCLGLDWSYLNSGGTDSLIMRFQPETVVFTNYTYRYAKTDKLDSLRLRFPGVKIVSVFENGAVEIALDKGTIRAFSAR